MKPTGGGHWRTEWPMERGMDSIRHPVQDFLELFHFISLIIKCINTRTKHKYMCYHSTVSKLLLEAILILWS